MSSDLRLSRTSSSTTSNGLDTDSAAAEDLRLHALRDTGQGTATGSGVTNLTTNGQQQIATGGVTTGTGTGARGPLGGAAGDHFGHHHGGGDWQKFRAESEAVKNATEDAAKDGTIDSADWDTIFGAAAKDGNVSMHEIRAMYAGLRDMHDKGSLDDTQYKDMVSALDSELTSRFDAGTAGQGLSKMAQMYVSNLEAGHADLSTDMSGGVQPADGSAGGRHHDGYSMGFQNKGSRHHVDDTDDDELQQQEIANAQEDQAAAAARATANSGSISNDLSSTLADMGVSRGPVAHVSTATRSRT